MKSSAALIAALAALALAGCSLMGDKPRAPILSGSDSLEASTARIGTGVTLRTALERGALGSPISEQTSDACYRGSNSWKQRNGYAWRCGLSIEWLIPAETAAIEKILDEYSDHLVSVGCSPTNFWNPRAIWLELGQAGVDKWGEPFGPDDLPTSTAYCDDGGSIAISFTTPSTLALQRDDSTPDERVSFIGHNIDVVEASDAPVLVRLSAWKNYHQVSAP